MHSSGPNDSSDNLPDELYTIAHGAEVLKVRYESSQTSSKKPGDASGTGLHEHSRDLNPDLSQIPVVGVAIRACLMAKARDGSPIIDHQPTPAPCMTRDGNVLLYKPSPNAADYTYVTFDILSEKTTAPSAVTTPQSAPPEEPLDLSDGMEPKETAEPAVRPARPRKDIPTIAKDANGSIVSIVMSDKDGHAIAKGTGFLVSRNGHIVTNYHVIAEGSSAVVKLPDGAFFDVDGVLAFDKARDVAVIKAHGENFRTLTLGNSDHLQVGEDVVAIGNPLSLESTVSNGIVSGIRTSEAKGGKFLQVTTPISPGSSGGPLFNMAGEVVGITTMYLEGGENLNFAIPINDAKRLVLEKSSTIRALPNEPEAVKAQTHDGDTTDESHLREECTALARRIEKDSVPEPHASETWSFNYNVKYNRCFVLDSISGGSSVDNMNILFDGQTRDTLAVTMVQRGLRTGHIDYPPDSFYVPDGGYEVVQKYIDERMGNDRAPSSVPATTANTNPSDRDYYRQLYDAGGFSGNLPSYVCFSDDVQSGTFFTFTAYAYDADYYVAQARVQAMGSARLNLIKNGVDPGPYTPTPEEKNEFNIMEARQRTMPYVTLLMEGLLESFSPETQRFFRGGGRLLEETGYEKGVKLGYRNFHWDGSSWFISSPPPDPNAYSRTSKISYLSIEPTTMRYAESVTVTITVGSGQTAATDTSRYGPWTGVCEKVPNPK